LLHLATVTTAITTKATTAFIRNTYYSIFKSF